MIQSSPQPAAKKVAPVFPRAEGLGISNESSISPRLRRTNPGPAIAKRIALIPLARQCSVIAALMLALAPLDAAAQDTDGDGLLDSVETDTGTYIDATNTGTDPLLLDTDGDNWDDGTEVTFGTDPTDPTSSLDPNSGKLLAPDGAAGDLFGSVAFSSSGNTAIVGANGDDTAGGSDAGSAHVFTRDPGGSWTHQEQLLAPGGVGDERFGSRVALASLGDTAIVGAYRTDTAGGADAGSAHVFVRDPGGNWTHQEELLAPDGLASDFFGYSATLSSSGDTAIVGANRDNTEGGNGAGSAHVFTRDGGGTWTHQQKLLAPDGLANDSFGESVALSSSGDTALVGANYDDTIGGSNAGSAYVFTRDGGGTWTFQQQFLAPTGAMDDQFGFSVALSSSGDAAIVGAYEDDTAGGSGAGSASVFSRDGDGVWTFYRQFLAPDGAAGNRFGASVALTSLGDAAIVGSTTDETAAGANAGSAYVFDLDTDGDGTLDMTDNCPLTANPNQIDSNDDGVGDLCESPDFSFPGLLNTNGTTDSEYDAAPKIVTDGSGLWLAAWESQNSIAEAPMGDTSGTDSDIFFARSTDAGATWTDPGLLNTNATFDSETSNDGEVDLATDGAGIWIAVWESDEDLGGAGADFDIFVARSKDNGLTWKLPELLNTNGDTDLGFDANPTVATDGAGHWVVSWESDENLGGAADADNDIFIARSSDNGISWTSPELLNSNGNSDFGGDGAVRIVSDQAGQWVAAWYSEEDLNGTAGTDLDIFVARSSDNGLSWSAPEVLNQNGETDSAQDALPQLSTDMNGNWVAAWASASDPAFLAGGPVDVRAATSLDNGVTWAASTLLDTEATAYTELAEFMTIGTDKSGHWLAVWPSDRNLGGDLSGDVDLFVVTSGDNGATWTTPALLNINGESDLGMDIAPQILTDGNGNWVAGWCSPEDLNGTAGATDWDIFVATTDDIDGDEVPDLSDAFPLDPLESTDTDGDGTGNNADLDDDGDGIEDVWETNTGIYVGPGNTGTNPLNPDTDGDGILDGADLAPLDGADCRSPNPQLRLVWGRDAPFGVEHLNDPGIGHRYLMDGAATLPGLASDDVRLPASLPASLLSGLQALFGDARADYPALPATENGLQISTLTAADPLPAQGTPGSPSLLYIIDRSALEDPVTDPDFGPLEGFAFSGVNRFNKRCTGGVGSVFVDADAVPPFSDPGYGDHVSDLVETIAHEAGHLYGLRHVLPDGLGACVGDPAEPGPTPAVMDYYPDGSAAELANCTGTPGQGCPVTEPPDCTGEDTGEDHNPLYHYLHYVVGESTADLAAAGITPGAWDRATAPVVVWRIEFNFIGSGLTDPNQVFYNFTLIEILPGGEVGEVRAVFSEITLVEINGDPGAVPPIPPLTVQIAQSSGLMITASSLPPTPSDPVPPQDYILKDPVYPPASEPPAPGTVVSSQLLKLDENNSGEFTAEFQASGTPEPSYLIQSGGLADPADGVYEIPPGSTEPTQLTSSTYTCADCFPAMTVTDIAPTALSNQMVPEPGFGAGLAAGLAGLLVARRHRSRKRRVE